MVTTLQIVDPESLGTVLFDLNDATGANSSSYGSVSTYLLHDPDWGVPEQKSTSSADLATPSAFVTFSQQALANVKLRIRIKATSYDNLTLALGTLAQYLSQGCVMKWVANSSAESRYIDIEASPTPVLLHGQELAMFHATTLFDTPEGITLALKRQPFMRGAPLTPTTNLLNNGTLIRDADSNGTPEGWTITSTPTLTIQSSTDSLHAVCSAATQGVYQSTGAASASSGQVWTLSADVKVTSGTAALIMNWRTNADADISSVTTTSTSAGWTRITASGTAPATTDRIRVKLESSGGASTIDWKNVQLELASTASSFRVRPQTVTVDPAATTGFVNILPIYNPGSAPAPVGIRTTFPDASNTTTTLLYGLRTGEAILGRYRQADYLNTTHYAQCESSSNGWTVTLGTDTSAVAGGGSASGAGSNVARITHATATTVMTKRISLERTTVMDSLRGNFDVYARILAGDARKYRIQLKWAYGNVSPMPNVNDEYLLDTTEATAFNWIMVPLGRISIPTETDATVLGKIKLEIWAAQKANTAKNLDVDYLRFIPSDNVWVYTPEANRTKWLAEELTTPVSDPAGGTAVTIGTNTGVGLFDTSTDNAGTPAITDVGHHSTTFTLGAQKYSGADRTLKINIRNTTDNVDVVSKTVTVRAGNNFKKKTLEWDAVAGKSYQAQVDDPSGVGSYYLYVRSIVDRFTPVMEQNTSVQTDPGSRPTRRVVEKLDSSNNSTMVLDSTGVPFWVPPGLSLIYIEPWDTIGKNYTEPTHNLARTMTVQATVYPRWWV